MGSIETNQCGSRTRCGKMRLQNRGNNSEIYATRLSHNLNRLGTLPRLSTWNRQSFIFGLLNGYLKLPDDFLQNLRALLHISDTSTFLEFFKAKQTLTYSLVDETDDEDEDPAVVQLGHIEAEMRNVFGGMARTYEHEQLKCNFNCSCVAVSKSLL
jgi:hypothetical protein